MGGTSKEEMKKRQEEHFRALRQINPGIKRLVLFDYDTDVSFHPDENNPVMKEWKRKNIENYLLVPEAWKKAILDVTNQKEFNLFNLGYKTIIEDFFDEQNLTLPPKSTWATVRANIFSVVDGKKILFEESDSLFQRIKKVEDLKVNREKVASNMSKDMIHEDVIHFFNLLTDIVS